MVFYVIKSVHDSDDRLSYIFDKPFRYLNHAQGAFDSIVSDGADTDKFELYAIDLNVGTNRLISSARGHLET